MIREGRLHVVTVEDDTISALLLSSRNTVARQLLITALNESGGWLQMPSFPDVVRHLTSTKGALYITSELTVKCL